MYTRAVSEGQFILGIRDRKTHNSCEQGSLQETFLDRLDLQRKNPAIIP